MEGLEIVVEGGGGDSKRIRIDCMSYVQGAASSSIVVYIYIRK